jgi:aspartate-semialdehyde dehydrogenase
LIELQIEKKGNLMGLKVGIVGATGLVGGELLRILEQRKFPVDEIFLFASDRSAGRKMTFLDEEIEVTETSDKSFRGIDIAFFSAGGDISKYFSPVAAKSGAIVIDNSSVFRMDPAVPLVVPEVNPRDIEMHTGIIANPNCSTIQMVVALNPIHEVNPIKRIIVSTYQAVSGTGAAGVNELAEQIAILADGRPSEIRTNTYPNQIAFNAMPFVEGFLDNDYTIEEWKMLEETRKILHEPDLPLVATCVRVPVYTSHGESVNIELTRAMSSQEAREILARAPGVSVQDNPGEKVFPLPLSATGTDDVFVGRIREDISHPSGLAMWIVADNLRKGAALNAVQIAEKIVK